MKAEAGARVMQPQAQGLLEPRKLGEAGDPLLEPREGDSPAQTQASAQ